MVRSTWLLDNIKLLLYAIFEGTESTKFCTDKCEILGPSFAKQHGVRDMVHIKQREKGIEIPGWHLSTIYTYFRDGTT